MKNESSLDSSLKILAKSSLIVLVGVFTSKIFFYLYRIILARNFGTEIYGLFSLTLMIFGFFAAFFSLGLQSGVLRYISFYRGKNEENKIRYLFRTSLKVILPISIIAGLLLFFLSDIISENIFRNPVLSIFLKWFAFFIPISLFGGIFHVVLRAYEKMKWYTLIGNIIAIATQLIFLVLLIFFDFKNNSIIISYNLGFVAVLISSFIVCKKKIPEIFLKPDINKIERKKIIRDLFSYSWPVMFLGLVLSIFSWIDSFSIGYFKTAADVGMYNAAVPIASILIIVPALFLQLFFPLITKEYSKKNLSLINDLSKQIGKWIFILNLPILILMILFPGAVINILFGSEFVNAATSLKFLAIGMFFYSIFTISENLLSMREKTKITLMSFVLAAFLNITLNIILVPRYGINGAAISTMLSYIFWSILTLFMAKKYTSIIPLKRKMIRVFLVSLIPTLILFFIRNFFEINLLVIVLLGLMFFLLYFFLILFTRCFDRNDILILNAIKRKISKSPHLL